MAQPQRTQTPTVVPQTPNDRDGEWSVVLFNCNCHTFEQVIVALREAQIPQGSRLAMQIHQKGGGVVFRGSLNNCEVTSEILEGHGLNTDVHHG